MSTLSTIIPSWRLRPLPAAAAALLLVLAACSAPAAEDAEPDPSAETMSALPACRSEDGVVLALSPRTVRHPAGEVGASVAGGVMERIALPPADSYVFDYTVTFRPEFDWDSRRRGGKLPGLAGGSGTGGCRAIAPDGWSARQTWQSDGRASLYLYHQDRKSGCGDRVPYVGPDGRPFRFVEGRTYRLTERVRVNTPGAADGTVEVWVDGVRVVDRQGLRLRGDVPTDVGRVSELKYHSYFGGKQPAAPDFDSYIDYGPVRVLDRLPDFAAPVPPCG